MAANGISTLSTKQLKQEGKLAIAEFKRKGYTLNADGTQNFGSAQFSGSNYLSITTKTAFGFGTGDFTIEGWYYHTTGGANHRLFDFRSTTPQLVPMLGIGTSNNIYLYINGVTQITAGTNSMPTNAWTHIAVVRASGVTKMFVNGTQAGATYADANDYGSTRTLFIGADYAAANGYVGYMSNIRIVKGTAVYTSSFTPAKFLSAVSGTQLLLNTDNGATFLKDTSTNNFTLTNTGSVATASTGPGPDTNAPFYRTRNVLDINLLPTKYSGNTIVDNANSGGLVTGRPWTT